MYKVLIEGSSYSGCEYRKMFVKMGFIVVDGVEEDPDLVCFTGGADVNPALYGKALHPTTHYSERRDDICLALYEYAITNSKHMVGICRGSQFLCVANGGELWQDIDGHCGNHEALTINNEKFVVTSTHHQEMNPKGGQVLLTASCGSYRSTTRPDGLPVRYIATTPTIEAVLWKDTKCLGVQGHPEFAQAGVVFKSWFDVQVRELLCVD